MRPAKPAAYQKRTFRTRKTSIPTKRSSRTSGDHGTSGLARNFRVSWIDLETYQGRRPSTMACWSAT